MIDDSLEDLPDGAVALHAQLLARKAAALAPPERPDECLGMAREALRLVEPLTDPVTRLEVAVAVGSAFAEFAHPRERLRVNREMVDRAREVGDRALELRGLGRVVVDYYALGDFPRGDALRRRARRARPLAAAATVRVARAAVPLDARDDAR